MLTIAPWLAWLAAITSLVLLAFRTTGDGETPRAWLANLWIWFAAALYLQFSSPSGLLSAGGLAAQTLLAIVLLVWWKLDA